MILGNPSTFAIETGAIEYPPQGSGPFIQFRFWIDDQPFGDWQDRIPLQASIENACILCKNERYRHEWLFDAIAPADVFQKIYDGFFEYDYTRDPILSPNLRDRFHLDDIGMDAIQDKYGLVLVQNTATSERVIAKDKASNIFLVDLLLPTGYAESVLNTYIKWGRSEMRVAY